MSAKWKLQFALIRAGFTQALPDAAPDICIAIGGDGTFLRMVRECKFNPASRYCGVNTGALGFLQEIRVDEINSLVSALKTDNFTENQISVLDCKINDDKTLKCFNEIIIRDKELRILKLELRIDGELTQKFSGDGLLICTSAGSTGHNMSVGGSLIPFEIDTMQITPLAPLNSITYKSLSNSILTLPQSTIDLTPTVCGTNVNICADGIIQEIPNFTKMQVTLSSDRIRYIKINTHTFWEKINKKFIGQV